MQFCPAEGPVEQGHLSSWQYCPPKNPHNPSCLSYVCLSLVVLPHRWMQKFHIILTDLACSTVWSWTEHPGKVPDINAHRWAQQVFVSSTKFLLCSPPLLCPLFCLGPRQLQSYLEWASRLNTPLHKSSSRHFHHPDQYGEWWRPASQGKGTVCTFRTQIPLNFTKDLGPTFYGYDGENDGQLLLPLRKPVKDG